MTECRELDFATPPTIGWGCSTHDRHHTVPSTDARSSLEYCSTDDRADAGVKRFTLVRGALDEGGGSSHNVGRPCRAPCSITCTPTPLSSSLSRTYVALAHRRRTPAKCGASTETITSGSLFATPLPSAPASPLHIVLSSVGEFFSRSRLRSPKLEMV